MVHSATTHWHSMHQFQHTAKHVGTATMAARHTAQYLPHPLHSHCGSSEPPCTPHTGTTDHSTTDQNTHEGARILCNPTTPSLTHIHPGGTHHMPPPPLRVSQPICSMAMPPVPVPTSTTSHSNSTPPTHHTSPRARAVHRYTARHATQRAH